MTQASFPVVTDQGGQAESQKRPARVLEVLYSYRMGGSEILASRLAKALHNRGHDVATCSLHTEKGVISEDLEEAGIYCKSFDLEHRSRFLKLFFPFQLYWFLKRNRFDVMHVHHIFVLRHCYWAARLAGVRHIVVTEHSDHEFREHAGLRRDGHRLGNLADKVTVIHNGMGDYFRKELSVAGDKIRLVCNSVDTQTFYPGTPNGNLRKELQLSPECVICGWVGRFHEAKDIGTLLEAFSLAVAPAINPSALVMVGDGAEKESAMRHAERLGIADNVFFLGERKDIPDLMRSFDLYVSSSKKEGVPLVLLEAMATGLACVVTDVGGVADIVTESTGIMVPPQRPDLLASALRAVVDNPDKRQRLGASALARVQQEYRFDTMVDRFTQVLKLDESCHA